MKKEDLRYDPVHDKIASIIEYIDNNKNVAIQVLLAVGLIVGAWGYYSGIERDRLNISKSLVGVAQNAYNAGQTDLSLPELKNIFEEYAGTAAANQAFAYLLKDAYQDNNDRQVKSLADQYGDSGPDEVLNAGFYETFGNADMNVDEIDAAINNFKKADKLFSIVNNLSQYKIDLAIALIANKEFAQAFSVLSKIVENENVSYSDKNKAEELLALANFSKDN